MFPYFKQAQSMNQMLGRKHWWSTSVQRHICPTNTFIFTQSLVCQQPNPRCSTAMTSLPSLQQSVYVFVSCCWIDTSVHSGAIVPSALWSATLVELIDCWWVGAFVLVWAELFCVWHVSKLHWRGDSVPLVCFRMVLTDSVLKCLKVGQSREPRNHSPRICFS